MRIALFTALFALGIGGAFAATEDDWLKVDANGDGRVSLQDMQAIYFDTTPDIFKDYDANRDGWLDREEFLSSMPASELSGMYNIRPRQ